MCIFGSNWINLDMKSHISHMATGSRLFLLFLLLFPSSGQSTYKLIHTKYGPIRGRVSQLGDPQLPPVAIFLGIPFATPPMANLRFMPPVTASPWREVHSATTFGPVCPQVIPNVTDEAASLSTISAGRREYILRVTPFLRHQSEDCLYLNVYASMEGGGGTKLPVVLFIHGESFSWGSGNLYDGSAFAAYGRILVITINYRLGILGFLNTNTGGTSSAPSNLGILDQIAALHWIQENIQDFGGDPTNVTIMGHGTGAACVHYLMTSDALPNGLLFHRVILMSGSALSPWARASASLSTSRRVAVALSCPTDHSHAMVKCLREAPLSKLLSVTETLSSRFSIRFGPSFDGLVVHSFRHKVGEYLERIARYDLLFGVCVADAYILLNHKEMEYGLETDGRNEMLSDFVSASYNYHEKEIFSTILTEYTDWHSTSRHPVSIRDNTVQALNDGMYVAPIIETGDYHASLNKKSWFYVFDYQTKYGDYKQRQGCVHGQEIPYIFGLPLLANSKTNNSVNYTKVEMQLSEAVMIYWTNFITTGNPNHPRTQESVFGKNRQDKYKYANYQWEAYDPKFKKYLQIGLKPKMLDHYRSRQVALWLNLIPDLVKSGQMEKLEVENSSIENEEYLLYNEKVSLIPNIKLVTIKENSRPASYQVVDGSKTTPPAAPPPLHRQNKEILHSVPAHWNDSYIIQDGSLTSYSTALSVTIAIGCSLLILNILIFAAVYYQRDRNKLGSRYNLSHHTEEDPTDLPTLSQHKPPLPNRPVSQYRLYTTGHTQNYLPPPQFADPGENSSVGNDRKFSQDINRKYSQPSVSDSQPLILGTTFKTMPRNLPTHASSSSFCSSGLPHVDGSQTLPLKSSLKKSGCHTGGVQPECSADATQQQLRV